MSTATLERPRPTLHLDIILYQQDDDWVAHCLQFDVVTASKEKDTAFENAQRLCAAQVIFALENNRISSLFRPPDPHLMELMFKAQTDGELSIRYIKTVTDERSLQFQKVVARAA